MTVTRPGSRAVQRGRLQTSAERPGHCLYQLPSAKPNSLEPPLKETGSDPLTLRDTGSTGHCSSVAPVPDLGMVSPESSVRSHGARFWTQSAGSKPVPTLSAILSWASFPSLVSYLCATGLPDDLCPSEVTNKHLGQSRAHDQCPCHLGLSTPKRASSDSFPPTHSHSGSLVSGEPH